MNELVKWAWIAVLCILTLGTDVVWYLLGAVAIAVFVLIVKPEWRDKM